MQLALINKSAIERRFTLGNGMPRKHWKNEWHLTAPGTNAKQHVSLVEVRARTSPTYVVAPY